MEKERKMKIKERMERGPNGVYRRREISVQRGTKG